MRQLETMKLSVSGNPTSGDLQQIPRAKLEGTYLFVTQPFSSRTYGSLPLYCELRHAVHLTQVQ